MRTLTILALNLALITMAAAQTPTLMPKTSKIVNDQGQLIATMTQWANKFTLRDAHGEPIGTIVVGVGGSKKFYDPNGKEAPPPQIADLPVGDVQ